MSSLTCRTSRSHWEGNSAPDCYRPAHWHYCVNVALPTPNIELNRPLKVRSWTFDVREEKWTRSLFALCRRSFPRPGPFGQIITPGQAKTGEIVESSTRIPFRKIGTVEEQDCLAHAGILAQVEHETSCEPSLSPGPLFLPQRFAVLSLCLPPLCCPVPLFADLQILPKNVPFQKKRSISYET